MLFKTFWLSMPLPERLTFAKVAGSSYSTLNQLSSVGRQVSPVLAVAIEQATSGQVTRQDLRPDDWHLIWPELIPTEAA
ncbi:MAG: YdaS family helix-turn-helix protein [Sulfuricellaceae bacterium]|nr:YdaS family helix-turn-helix protein [Sulfuricellaceae bacterium]